MINASLAGVLDYAGQTGRFPAVLGLRHGIEGALHDETLRLDGLSVDQRDALAATPAAALGSCRRKLQGDDYDRILETFRRHDVRWFCYVGGNDSMDTCHRLQERAVALGYDLAVFGVPKTIDNDLVETDHCPGFGSAARYWATTTPEVTLDLAAMRNAAIPFVGTHDFTTFCKREKVERPDGSVPSLVREVRRAEWSRVDDRMSDGMLAFEIEASSFCRQMVRSIVGTLVDVGLGKRRAGDVPAMLRARDRTMAGQVAPPEGLVLWEVRY